MEKDFIIDKASWHTQKVRNYSFDNKIIYGYFETVIRFLQEEGLTTRIIISDFSNIGDETCIKASDLTDEGMSLIKKVYGRWVDYVVDNNKPSDTSILARALKKIKK